MKGELMKAWSDLRLPGVKLPPEFKVVDPTMDDSAGQSLQLPGWRPRDDPARFATCLRGTSGGKIETHVGTVFNKEAFLGEANGVRIGEPAVTSAPGVERHTRRFVVLQVLTPPGAPMGTPFIR